MDNYKPRNLYDLKVRHLAEELEYLFDNYRDYDFGEIRTMCILFLANSVIDELIIAGRSADEFDSNSIFKGYALSNEIDKILETYCDDNIIPVDITNVVKNLIESKELTVTQKAARLIYLEKASEYSYDRMTKVINLLDASDCLVTELLNSMGQIITSDSDVWW